MKHYKVKNKLDSRIMAAAKGNDYACKLSSEELDALCEKLVKWAEEDESIHFATFCRKELNKSRAWLIKTAEHYPKLKVAYEHARELLAAKMVNACFHDQESKVNATFGEKYLPIYDTEYKEIIKWKAQLQNLGLNDPKNLSALQEYLDKIKETK